MIPRFGAALLVWASFSLPLAAQPRSISARADSAFEAGNVRLADSLYYVAVRFRPRDPDARAALGRYLAAQGRTKVAIVLLEEARMFGGDPAVIARDLAPLYEHIGEWRALLTMPGSPLTSTERRRAAWLSEHPFGVTSEGGAMSIIGTPQGDTIARVSARVAGKAATAAIVATDVGFMIGSRLAGNAGRTFGGDSTILTFDSVTVGQVKFVNVPATIGAASSNLTVGAAALGRLVVQLDYKRNRIALSRTDVGNVAARYPLVRAAGLLRVLDGGRWVSLGDFAAAIAKASKTMVIDVAAGEVRVRP